MLKKMRQRVIVAAMLAFSAVIMLIGVSVNVVNYLVVTNNADETLSAILSFEENTIRPEMQNPDFNVPPSDVPGQGPAADGGMPPFMGLSDLESNYMTRFFIVRFGENGNPDYVSIDYIASVGGEDALDLARRVYEKNDDHGYMGDYRYACVRKGNEGVVVFLNTVREQRSMRNLLLMTLAISGVSLVIVFILVALFSKRAIRPIAKNIEQQKQFITDASHELKTPLTSISTSMDVITMEYGESEWTENIRTQTGRLTKLVSELVTLSKMDEEMPLPNKEEFSLTGAAWESAESYKTQAKGAGKDFKIDIEDDITMLGEKTAIQQMLSVLLDNSIRYSDPEGEIRLSVYRKNGKIRMEVFNTCDLKEIPDVTRLFDRFYRPDSSRSTQTGGYGVGLAIAKAVAEAHGGEIWAECPSGKTMTIKVKI
ncbi:MAG: HAMP domain-containing histidine kinase [Lachnospiraceae bacterium]|nr:HAMP domain-containing histidine kinase [Lachnospiraceae bacterium]